MAGDRTDGVLSGHLRQFCLKFRKFATTMWRLSDDEVFDSSLGSKAFFVCARSEYFFISVLEGGRMPRLRIQNFSASDRIYIGASREDKL